MAASAKAQVAQALNPARHPSSRDGAAAASPSPTATRTTVTVVLVMYCASGTMMTLANKLAVRLFPFPNAIACLQNCVTVALLSMGAAVAPATFGAMPKLTRDTLRDWLPLTSLFVGMLVSSLLALMHVSAVTLIVIRNLTSLTVAALEAAVLHNATHPPTPFYPPSQQSRPAGRDTAQTRRRPWWPPRWPCRSWPPAH